MTFDVQRDMMTRRRMLRSVDTLDTHDFSETMHSIRGGYGRITGVAGAVLVLAAVENMLNLSGIDPSIRQIVYGAILLTGIYIASLQDRVRARAV